MTFPVSSSEHVENLEPRPCSGHGELSLGKADQGIEPLGTRLGGDHAREIPSPQRLREQTLVFSASSSSDKVASDSDIWSAVLAQTKTRGRRSRLDPAPEVVFERTDQTGAGTLVGRADDADPSTVWCRTPARRRDPAASA
jgi:hypothetical protein